MHYCCTCSIFFLINSIHKVLWYNKDTKLSLSTFKSQEGSNCPTIFDICRQNLSVVQYQTTFLGMRVEGENSRSVRSACRSDENPPPWPLSSSAKSFVSCCQSHTDGLDNVGSRMNFVSAEKKYAEKGRYVPVTEDERSILARVVKDKIVID